MNAAAMFPWHRHQLVRLNATAWAESVARSAGAAAATLDCLSHWAAHDLPLVVTRQPAGAALTDLSLGLPAPSTWNRLRLVLQAKASDLRPGPAFPSLRALLPQLPPADRSAGCSLAEDVAALGASVRVHGSFGWQHLTGLDHVRPRSDLDLLIDVANPAMADAVVTRLARATIKGRRLDGELMFPSGSAVAWREWAAWREGRCAQVLVKRLQSVVLADRLEQVLPSPSDLRGEAVATGLS